MYGIGPMINYIDGTGGYRDFIKRIFIFRRERPVPADLVRLFDYYSFTGYSLMNTTPVTTLTYLFTERPVINLDRLDFFDYFPNGYLINKFYLRRLWQNLLYYKDHMIEILDVMLEQAKDPIIHTLVVQALWLAGKKTQDFSCFSPSYLLLNDEELISNVVEAKVHQDLLKGLYYMYRNDLCPLETISIYRSLASITKEDEYNYARSSRFYA
jgi:hypothetical protein